jgi:hypothetical protein
MLTAMLPVVTVRLLAESVAVMVCEPTVFSVAVNKCDPASAAVKV